MASIPKSPHGTWCGISSSHHICTLEMGIRHRNEGGTKNVCRTLWLRPTGQDLVKQPFLDEGEAGECRFYSGVRNVPKLNYGSMTKEEDERCWAQSTHVGMGQLKRARRQSTAFWMSPFWMVASGDK